MTADDEHRSFTMDDYRDQLGTAACPCGCRPGHACGCGLEDCECVGGDCLVCDADADGTPEPDAGLPHHRGELRALVAQLRAERDQARAEAAELRANLTLAASLRREWGVQAEHSTTAFPVRTEELAHELAAQYSRIREPGCLPTPHHVVTRYESDWQRVDTPQQPEDGDRG